MQIILRAKKINNRLVFTNPDYYKDVVTRLSEKYPILISIKNEIPTRSGKQNRYWHGVCFPILAEMTGYTVDEIKALCKELYSPTKTVTVKGIDVLIRKSTSQMNKLEGVEFTDKVRNLATDLGGFIPTPCEAGYFCGNDSCQICKDVMKNLSTTNL